MAASAGMVLQLSCPVLPILGAWAGHTGRDSTNPWAVSLALKNLCSLPWLLLTQVSTHHCSVCPLLFPAPDASPWMGAVLPVTLSHPSQPGDVSWTLEVTPLGGPPTCGYPLPRDLCGCTAAVWHWGCDAAVWAPSCADLHVNQAAAEEVEDTRAAMFKLGFAWFRLGHILHVQAIPPSPHGAAVPPACGCMLVHLPPCCACSGT